jgi:uncharacterized repeat protein (TIGR01451 family)
MLSGRLGALCALALACAPCAAPAANFDVNNPAEFQAALSTAQSNGQNDVINVLTCSGAGCMTDGTDVWYDIATRLTYTATATEGFSLTIDGFNSNTRILVGSGNDGILFIDTTAASDDLAAFIAVRGLTIALGNNLGTPNDGGGLNILINSARVEVSGSVFGGNAADGDGGGLFIRAESFGELPIQIFDVTFDSNSAGGNGGGAFVAASGSHFIEIFNVSFFDNDAANGGGLHVEGIDPADPAFERVAWVQLSDFDFWDNIARSGNGGGADIATNDLDVEIGGFVRNLANAGSGAGLYVRRNIMAFDMVNTGFTGNEAGIDGGGFATELNSGPVVTITNNTIYANSAVGRGGGGLLTIGGSTGIGSVYNNIIYNNTNAVSGRDIYIDNDPFTDIPVTVNFFNNDISDLTGFPDASTFFEIAVSSALSSGANIDGEPLLPLIGEIEPDPSQAVGSPTIDMGENTAPGAPSVDFEGDSRPMNGIIDIGMDEFVAGALPQTDLSVTKTDSPDPVTGGGNVTYTITVSNNGPDTATGVTVTDTLDQTVSLVSAIFNQGSPCTSSGTPIVIVCNLGDLEPGNSAPGTIVVTTPVVTVNSGIANSVTVTGNETDPDTANNTAQQGTTVLPPAGPAQADLAVSKIDTPDPVFSGGPALTYTITVDNNGPDTATGVTLSDTLPAGVSFQSATASVGQCDEMPDMGGTLSCGLGSLTSGSNATVTIVVLPEVVSDPATITNTATALATEEDPTPANNTAAEDTTVNPPSADMSVTTTSSPASPMINEQVTYGITVSNAGPSDNTGVVMTVTLPASATFGSVTIDQGTCDVGDGTVTCTIGDLASGASVNATIIVTAPNEPMILTLSATIVADAEDPDAGNNADSADVTVIDVVDLVIQGTSEGTGSFTWPTLLLLAFAAIYSFRNRLRQGATLALFGFALLGLMLPVAESRAQSDWYIGASVGQAGLDYSAGDLQQDLANLGWSINNPSVNDSGTAWKAYVGFTLNEYFALEAGYADLGKVVTRFGATIPPTQVDAILSDTFRIHPYQGDGWFGAAVVNWPVSPDRFNVFARLGFFGWESDLDVRVISGGTGSITDRESGTDTMYGVGVEWRINEQWSVTGEWERYKLNEWLDVPMVGLRFSF